MSYPSFTSEWHFTQAVIDLAESLGWERPFHIPARAYRSAHIPRGFPDLILRYKHNDGNCTMIVVELKTDKEDSVASDEQLDFLNDFAKQHIPTFILRYQDWDYIERILKEGPPDSTGQIIEPSSEIIRRKPWLPSQRNTAAIVRRLVEDIAEFPRGHLSGLRRMDPDAPDIPAFWQLMSRERLLNNQGLENRWALIIHGIALMTPNAHDRYKPVGKALFDGGDTRRMSVFYSETRLKKLLNARGPMFRTLLARMFRMMGAAGQSFDWCEMAWLILSKEDSVQAEESRLKIAREYYRAEYHAKQGNSQ